MSYDTLYVITFYPPLLTGCWKINSKTYSCSSAHSENWRRVKVSKLHYNNDLCEPLLSDFDVVSKEQRWPPHAKESDILHLTSVATMKTNSMGKYLQNLEVYSCTATFWSMQYKARENMTASRRSNRNQQNEILESYEKISISRTMNSMIELR